MFARKYLFPYVIAGFYFLWTRTWRFRVIENPAFSQVRLQGKSIVFAFWHGDEMAVILLGPRYKAAAMTSTSKDGELITGVLRLFGFAVSRGSSTRGGVRALVGLIQLARKGYTATVAVDGPKGPYHKVKPGVIDLAKHVEGAIIPTGVASSRSYVFQKSWNKAHLPLPFSKVVVSFGKPIENPSTASVEEALLAEGREAQRLLNN
jgi:lysophospholipid acyltransferase (LPLAT)-like uncharacterized protein